MESDTSGSEGPPLSELRARAKKSPGAVTKNKSCGGKSRKDLHKMRTKGLAGARKGARKPIEDKSPLLKRYSDWVMTKRQVSRGGRPPWR